MTCTDAGSIRQQSNGESRSCNLELAEEARSRHFRIAMLGLHVSGKINIFCAADKYRGLSGLELSEIISRAEHFPFRDSSVKWFTSRVDEEAKMPYETVSARH